jgi:hypothetical protein
MAEAFGRQFISELAGESRDDRLNHFQVISRSISEDYEPVGSPASTEGVVSNHYF